MDYELTDIKQLYGVGAAKAARYGALGISTVGELLRHYPRGYENRGVIIPLDRADGEEKHSHVLTVATVPTTAVLKGRMTLTKFRAYDDSASCEVIFFNQEYLKSTFVPGAVFRFYGKAELKGGRITMTSPSFDAWSEVGDLPCFVPIYPLTEGLSQKQVAKDIRSALTLAAAGKKEDILPMDIQRRNILCVRSFAVRNIHTPKDFSGLEAAKKRLIFEEFFFFALRMQFEGIKRRSRKAYPCTRGEAEELFARLPYEPTGAQRRVIDEIKADMSSDTAMCRIVIGDVGSGKTLCSAAAMLFAVRSGYQAALMAPTEILARQHFETVSKLFEPMGINVKLLIGATAAGEKRKIKQGLLCKKGEKGRVDVIIGTQALISEGVEFDSLGLAVADEQHRFGVEQRAELARKNPLCHTLVMSATPIPRSFALALYGDLDISLIDEVPAGRQKVDTFVVDESYRERLNAFIKKQVTEGGQVYIVCPAVEESEDSEGEDERPELFLRDVSVRKKDYTSGKMPERNDYKVFSPEKPKLKSAVGFCRELSEALPELSVDFLHGKLKSREKEEKMRSFAEGRTDVLVSTTVIEVGVNVPRATLMIVENAERFGLSQLHQLRGRVGRGDKKAYCVLVSDAVKGDGAARERLMTLKNSHDGYEIAEKDLAMRGPGDFLGGGEGDGVRQSGELKFRLASLCDDSELMKNAFSEARAILSEDSTLESYPLLKEELKKYCSDSSVIS